MKDKPENPPAFPSGQRLGHDEGMTLRDWFAGQALESTTSPAVIASRIEAARCSYAAADAMLVERAKERP